MIIFVLLLIIIAIMLFGSSAVLGFLGAALGGIVGIFALGMALQLWNSLTLAGQATLVGVPIVVLLTMLALIDRISNWRARRPNPFQQNQIAARAYWSSLDHRMRDKFSPSAEFAATKAMGAGDIDGLERICQSEHNRLKQSGYKGDLQPMR